LDAVITPEAEDRIRGQEVILEYVESIAMKTASDLHVSIQRMIVAPAWSHEYDDRTGIVIDIDIDADNDRRFALWDAICEQLDQEQSGLSEKERRFLEDDVSVSVNRI